jgi:uncharacterized protein
MLSKWLHVFFVFLFFSIDKAAVSQSQVFDKKYILLQPLDFQAVTLTGGNLKEQLEEVKEYYLQISNDDLLKGFRERKNLPTRGAKDLGGWYSNDVFHVFGQIVAGLSRLYAATGDERCRQKSATLIEGWAQCIEDDGYFFYSRKTNAPHYVYEKMIGGLVDAYVFTDNKNALKYLSVITDWAVKNLNRGRIYGQTKSEWYTLSENLYRAYRITNDKKYLDFGKVWEYTGYWNSYINGGPPVDKQRHHAYSHLNTLSSAAAAYLVSGDEKFRTIIKNGYEYFQNEQCFATGGFGPNERMLLKDDLVKTLQSTHNSFETQCGSWAVFKLSKYLMEITGDAKYGDWIEKMIMNGIGVRIPMSQDGKVQYYSDYNPREGTIHNHHAGWSCCTGTRPQAVAEYANLVYFKDNNGLYVNLFTPSKLEWNNITINQVTKFPESNQTEFTINSTDAAKSFALSFRKPGWAKQMPVITVNGKKVQPEIASNWMKLKRTWKDGDKIIIAFLMDLYVDRLDEAKPFPAALMYGPVAMAVNATHSYPSDIVDVDKVSLNFTAISDKPLNYRVKDHSELTLRPYYQFASGEPYILYVDPVVKDVVLEKDLAFKGNWQKGRGAWFSNDKEASVATSFTGRGIAVYFGCFRNSGIMKVEIDGKQVDMVDTYRDEEGGEFEQIEKRYDNLPQGKHEIVVSVSGEKNAASRNVFINVFKFSVIH